MDVVPKVVLKQTCEVPDVFFQNIDAVVNRDGWDKHSSVVASAVANVCLRCFHFVLVACASRQ